MADQPLPPGVEVITDPIADTTGGACYLLIDGRAIIVLSPSLDEAQRRCAIEHELQHHHLGIVHPPATPATMETVERMVRRQVHRRLVPLHALEAFTADQLGEAVTTGMVMAEFGVDRTVARDALERLRARRGDEG